MNIEQIFETIQPAVITAVATLLAGLVAYGLRLAHQHFSVQQWQLAEQLIAQAVKAAEQYGGSGEEKKRQALEYAQAALAERGVPIDIFALDVAIEAAVFEEINRHRLGVFYATDGTAATEPA